MKERTFQTKFHGVTLLEVLLVLVIATVIIRIMVSVVQINTDELRRTRTSLQIQQVSNAGLAYYVANNRWPDKLSDLQGSYLPSDSFDFLSPWGKTFQLSHGTGITPLYVYTDVLNESNARLILGKLPLGFVTGTAPTAQSPQVVNCEAGKPCYIVSSIVIPPQSLNAESAINFASIYHSGACVPVPKCPRGKNGQPMHPEISVVPVSMSGINDISFEELRDKCVSDGQGYYDCDGLRANPITAFSARAIGPVNYPSQKPAQCDSDIPDSKGSNCYQDYPPYGSGKEVPPGYYWRICLSVSTTKGLVQPKWPGLETAGHAGWGNATGALLAVTRCVADDEDKGSSSFVWRP